MKSNCNIEAGSRFRDGTAKTIWMRKTEHSYLGEYAEKRWWQWTIRPIGYVLEWLGWLILQGACYLQDGRWLHAGWVENTEMREFAPEVPKTPQRFPPVWYEGAIYRVGRILFGEREIR